MKNATLDESFPMLRSAMVGPILRALHASRHPGDFNADYDDSAI